MIVRSREKLQETEFHVVTDNWCSTRLIVQQDNVGYSVHHTVIPKGHQVHCHYENHFETNYCIAGEGQVENLETGEISLLLPGTIYTLDKHDEHIVSATTADLHLVCVFSPALTGKERHNDTHGYDPS